MDLCRRTLEEKSRAEEQAQKERRFRPDSKGLVCLKGLEGSVLAFQN